MVTVPAPAAGMHRRLALNLLTTRGPYVSLKLIGTVYPGHYKEETWVFLLGLFSASSWGPLLKP
jgi:hypothetical protein